MIDYLCFCPKDSKHFKTLTFKMIFTLKCLGLEQTSPWVVPLRTSHLKFLRPIQLQNNIGFILKNLFTPNYLSKGYPNHIEFKILIKFTKKMHLMWKMTT